MQNEAKMTKGYRLMVIGFFFFCLGLSWVYGRISGWHVGYDTGVKSRTVYIPNGPDLLTDAMHWNERQLMAIDHNKPSSLLEVNRIRLNIKNDANWFSAYVSRKTRFDSLVARAKAWHDLPYEEKEKILHGDLSVAKK